MEAHYIQRKLTQYRKNRDDIKIIDSGRGVGSVGFGGRVEWYLLDYQQIQNSSYVV